MAAYVLAVLTERGLLTVREGRYRYRPRNPELDQQVAGLATSYSTNLIAVTHLVHAKPAPGVRQFAEAFRLRKDG